MFPRMGTGSISPLLSAPAAGRDGEPLFVELSMVVPVSVDGSSRELGSLAQKIGGSSWLNTPYSKSQNLTILKYLKSTNISSDFQSKSSKIMSSRYVQNGWPDFHIVPPSTSSLVRTRTTPTWHNSSST